VRQNQLRHAGGYLLDEVDDGDNLIIEPFQAVSFAYDEFWPSK
jgi:hypothetical protein